MEMILPNAKQIDNINTFLAIIASKKGGDLNLGSASDIQRITRLGLARKALSVGDQFEVEKGGGTLTFDIVDFDKHLPASGGLTHSVALCLHEIATHGILPFSAPQLLYYTENGLPAGNYKFTLDHAMYNGDTTLDGTYMFTLTQPIPADGGFRHTGIGGYKSSYAISDVVGNHIQTYGARPDRNVIESNVTVDVWDETTSCTDLGTFTARDRSFSQEVDDENGGKRNFTERNACGSNRWRDSTIRQWLNSDASAVAEEDTETVSLWWNPQTVFDMPPSGARLAGFLHGVDSDFVSALGDVEVKTALCDADRVGDVTYDITIDKVWLPSMTEVLGSNNGDVAEGSPLSYWVGADSDDRIKYEGATALYWKLRSPYPTEVANVRGINPAGVRYDSGAHYTDGIVPMCCIV